MMICVSKSNESRQNEKKQNEVTYEYKIKIEIFMKMKNIFEIKRLPKILDAKFNGEKKNKT